MKGLIDEAEVRRFLAVIMTEDAVSEIRKPKAGRYKTISGYFDNQDLCVKDLQKLNGDGARYLHHFESVPAGPPG